MRFPGRVSAVALGFGLVALSAALGQALPTAAKVDTEPMDLTEPDRYAVACVLEPIRKVTLIAQSDGFVVSQDAQVGANVRVGQDVARLDSAEAAARLKVADAELKQEQAALKAARLVNPESPVQKAQLEGLEARIVAAEGRKELAAIGVDRATLRAPFPGRVLASHVAAGQFVTKGAPLAELADVSTLKVLVPVLREGAVPGSAVALKCEGNAVNGQIQSLVPLPEAMAVLHELATPITAGWVVIPNTAGPLEPGQRVVSPAAPVTPVAVIPAQALKSDDAASRSKEKGKPSADAPRYVQVIRNEYVANVKVRVLGSPSPDRLQVTGPLRATDALIVSTNVPLLPGTLIRFQGGESAGLEATSPNPSHAGAPAEVTAPRIGGTAPIGQPGSALPKTGRNAAAPPAFTKPAAAKPAAAVPF